MQNLRNLGLFSFIRNLTLALMICGMVSTTEYGVTQRSTAPSVSIVKIPVSVERGQTFSVTARAVSAVGIEYIGFQYEGKTLRLNAKGKKDVTLTAKFEAAKSGSQTLRVLAVATDKTQSKTLNRTINVITRIKKKGPYTVKPIEPISVDIDKMKIDPNAIIVVSSLSINPKPIFADRPSTATVTLNNPAPRGGLKLQVEVTHPDGNQASGFGLPFMLEIPARQREATFQLRTTKELPKRAHVSVIYSGIRVTEEVDVVWPPKVWRLTIEPDQIHAGETARATVHLYDPALEGGTEVELSSDQPQAVSLPRRIRIPENEKTGGFDFTVTKDAPEVVFIRAKTSVLSSRELQLPVNPPVILSSLRIEPQPAIVGQESTATVRLKEPAPEGGLNLKVDFSRGDGTVVSVFGPKFNITVPAGKMQQTFSLKAVDDLNENVAVSVVQGGYSVTEDVKVVWPPEIESFVIDPSPAVKGEIAQAAVVLKKPALYRGTKVLLFPKEPEAMTIPDEITIPEGETKGSFEIKISREAPETISIRARTSEQSDMWAGVSLNSPMFISSVSVDQKRIYIDKTASAMVNLKEPAPEGGLVLNPEIRDLQGGRHNCFVNTNQISVPAGAMTATFSFMVLERMKSESLCGTRVSVAVYQGGHEVSETVEIVCPPAVEAILIDPLPLLKGETVKATLTLSESAHAGGAKVNLLPQESRGFKMPFEITIPEGQKSGSFDITISPDAGGYLTINARTSSVRSKTQTFQVVPPLVVGSLTVDPLPIVVDDESRGTVIFNGPVIEGGFEFEVFIKTPEGRSAFGFDGPRFPVTVPAGVAQAAFPLKTTREYPDGAVVHILYKGYSIAEKSCEVASRQIIESLVVDPVQAQAGRSVSVFITLNRPALYGDVTEINLSVSGPAAQDCEIAESIIIPIGRTQQNFSVKVGSSAEGFFVVKAEIPTHSQSIMVNIKKIADKEL